MFVREVAPKTVRQAQHPLAHGYPRQHLIDEARGALRHAPAAAARAEAATLAGERHESLERALPAPEAGEAVRQHTTGEKILEVLQFESADAGRGQARP